MNGEEGVRQTELINLDGVLVEVSSRDIRLDLSSLGLIEEDELVGGPLDRLGAEIPRLEHTIHHFCEIIYNSVKGLKAKEVSAEFSIGFKGGVGVPFVASGEAEAIVKVTATWSQSANQ